MLFNLSTAFWLTIFSSSFFALISLLVGFWIGSTPKGTRIETVAISVFVGMVIWSLIILWILSQFEMIFR